MFATLIDKDGFKIDFDMKHFLEEKHLENGEEIIEKNWQIANSLLKPKWDFDNEVWIEAATEEEIEASKPPQIDICEPTDRERMEQIEGMVGMLAEQVARQSLGM